MEKIGNVIRKHRLTQGLTQEDLGNKLFVSKQAVSKWETGKTLPDIETVRKLCVILQIDKDEILGTSINEAGKKSKWVKALAVISVISILVALFFSLDGLGYIDRHTQSGATYLYIFSDGVIVKADQCKITSDLDFKDQKNGFKADTGYGEIRGSISVYDEYNIEFGFVNTNNWHNIQIRLDIEEREGQLFVRQTVSYETDNDAFQVKVNEETSTNGNISVFRDGV